ncbi:hypothetical protein, partial [Nocardia sp. NPDC004860]|uniref:hypothetical protein n=1 Tax=Nocardia sp. NPDC004860 TaxID=3154557 RepID=UPI0033BE5E08
MDHLPHIRFRHLHQLRDEPDRLMLRRRHHHHRPPHPNRLFATPRDLSQLPPFLGRHLPDEHIRLASHRHHLHRQHHRSPAEDQPATPGGGSSTNLLGRGT